MTTTADIETTTAAEAAHVVEVLHHDTLGISAKDITAARAEKLIGRDIQTTTEVLLLLARFHEGVDDGPGAALLADFALQFAALEAQTV